MSNPTSGGGVFELDFRPKRFNLSNVLGRRAEGYHQRSYWKAAKRRANKAGAGPVSIHDLTAVKSAGLEDLLVYDRHPRMTFIEHFLAEDTTLNNLASGHFDERGDFAGAPYDVARRAPRRSRSAHGAG